MKTALGIFIGIFISCVLFIVLAPNSVHEVIDRIHGNSDSNGEISVDTEDNSEVDAIPSDEKTDTVSESSVVPEDNSEEDVEPSDEKSEPAVKTKHKVTKLPPLVKGKRKVTKLPPLTEDEMLDWLERHDYTVGEGQGFYRIYWRNLTKVFSKPTAIVVSRDGKVDLRYEQTVVVNEDGASVVGQNVAINGNGNSVSNFGKASVTNRSGITNTASMEYRNGNWWIEVTRSFYWYPSLDSISDVLSKAKKIKETDNEN
ncbi:hypothetical protein C6501_05320 [Candidatus Poribacteria bacterium]|nr:MAG: hypothetical protein C6501_05320 [Candidatus Poribacteria bacterium]